MLLKLAESIASHICHELSNSIGACDASLEGVRVNSNPSGLDTAKLASESSISRIKYLRHMYGHNVMDLNLKQLVHMAQNLIHEGRAKLEFTFNKSQLINVASEIVLDGVYGKLLFAFIYMANGDLAYGGTIHVDIKHDQDLSDYEICISSSSNEVKPKFNILNILSADQDLEAIGPRNAVAYYAKYLSQAAGIKYRVVIQDNKVEYIFQYKYNPNDHNWNNW
jgi:hypothetical protein